MKIIVKYLMIFLCSFGILLQTNAQKLESKTFKGLEFRNLGPALTSGRIADIAIHPDNENIWFVAVGSGGVWKTENSGTTWKPIFDKQSSYSIGCLTIDKKNPHTIWVGTGENVGGRHVGFGDGIYKSDDDGKTWLNMGLKKSEHISKIIVHPKDSNIIWVAAQGPLWSKGGERGVYKSIDGGKTWNKTLGDNEWTGATDLIIDPTNPDILYAATWQRHRTVAMYLGGGPGSGIHKSEDGGNTWKKLTDGIPKSNLGKIGLAISPFDPNRIYAAIELDRTKGGFFMSINQGISWTKQSDAISSGTGPHYYQEIYASPHQEGRLYFMSNNSKITNDHGKTFVNMNEKNKHVDSHAVAFKKSDPNYVIFGTDGGLFESFDLTKKWRFVNNLPVVQYYKMAVDDASPFYNLYGGTQDNGSLRGPSQTRNSAGITNSDWFVTLGADGYQTATEPGNPNISYGEFQEGWLWRIDRTTGETVFIQPQNKNGEVAERFNWDAPILISPHNPSRLYYASQRVWRSDNRGDAWKSISNDLTHNQNRITLPIMGKQQSWDNSWDLRAMSVYNTITSLAESPKKEGLIYAGTDDGIIQVTDNGGESWKKIDLGSIKGIPSTAFVNDVRADLFDESTVYAALDNHKYGDFKPYLIKSTNKGQSWSSITGDLPNRTIIWRLVQDHINKNLLFLATEFGIYFSSNGGGNWIQLKGDIPTIAFRDIAIQRREDDLIGASFGRGFFVLDDISALRDYVSSTTSNKVTLYTIKSAYWYVQNEATYGQGDSEYKAKNPPFGAVFTYFLPEKFESLKEVRKKKEKELTKNKSEIVFPGWETIEKESREEGPTVLLQIKNKDGKVINTIKGTNKKGFNRVNWKLDYAGKSGVKLKVKKSNNPFSSKGLMATPGDYTVSIFKRENGKMTALAASKSFKVISLSEGALKRASYDEIENFTRIYQDFQQDLTSTKTVLSKNLLTVQAMKRALDKSTSPTNDLYERIQLAREQLLNIEESISGNKTKNEIGEKSKPNPGDGNFIGRVALGSGTYGPTANHKVALNRSINQLKEIKSKLKNISENVIPEIGKDLKSAGAPWIEGQGLID